MLSGFVTKSGSTYYVDTYNNIISGGKLRRPVGFTQLSAIIGTNALIYLRDGSILRTGVVVRYI